MQSSRLLLLWLVGSMLLGACALPAAPPSPLASETAQPTESPWKLGTPSPMFAPLAGDCPGKAPFPPQLAGVRYGTNLFLFGTDSERVLALADIAGFNWLRQQIHWRDLEGERGQFVWRPLDQIVSAARAHDQQIMLSVVRSPAWATAGGHDGLPDDPETLAIFLKALATRYRGRVAAYQVWNEPNLSHEGGGKPAPPADYLAVLKAAYPAIKEADPCALVVSAALASTNQPDPALALEDLPYFEALYTLDNGAFLRSADVVALHPGAGPHPPMATWPADAPEQSHRYFRHIERVRDLMITYGDPRQAWITEYGWTVAAAEGAPQPVTEEQQASYLVDTLWFIRQRYAWISGVFVWNLNFSVIAPPSDEKTTFSILKPDWSARPSFLALQHNVRGLRGADQPPFVPDTASHSYRWTFPARGSLDTPPLVAGDGTIYLVNDPGTLSALSPAGLLNWYFDAPGAVSAAPSRAPDGTLYLGDSGSLLTALQPDGSPLWTVRLDSPARGSPVVLGDGVAVVTREGDVLAFDSSGQQRWKYRLGAESTPLARTSDGALLVVSATGFAFKIGEDGRLVWRAALDNEFWSAPVPDETGGGYVVTVAGRVLALDSNGRVRWFNDLAAPVVAVPLVGHDARVYVAARDGTLSALDVADGRLHWRMQAGRDLAASPAQAADGTLYQGTDDEMVLAIGRNGTLLWRVQVRGAVQARPAIGPDGTLYVPTMGGLLYAFVRR